MQVKVIEFLWRLTATTFRRSILALIGSNGSNEAIPTPDPKSVQVNQNDFKTMNYKHVWTKTIHNRSRDSQNNWALVNKRFQTAYMLWERCGKSVDGCQNNITLRSDYKFHLREEKGYNWKMNLNNLYLKNVKFLFIYVYCGAVTNTITIQDDSLFSMESKNQWHT